MLIIVDEVGYNIDMTGDGHIGGEKFISKKGLFPKEKQQDKQNITFNGFTNLIGEPICCIVIIEDKKKIV